MTTDWNKIVEKNPLLYSLFVGKNMENASTAYCRLCAESKPADKLIDVNQMEEHERCNLISKLVRINANTNFELETLPRTVCLLCVSEVNKVFEFVCSIGRAQAVLQDLFLVQQIKKESVQSDNETNETCPYDADTIFASEPNIKIEDPQTQTLNNNDRAGSSLKSNTLKKNKPQKSSIKCNLDAIPLSQLKLTWKDYSWLCAFCSTQFPTIEELKIHSMQYHNSCNAYRCTDCNIRKLKLDRFIIHVKRHKTFLKLSCYRCFKRFQSPKKTNVHKDTHITTTNTCPGCNTCFESAEDLEKHTSTFYKDLRSRQIPFDHADYDALNCMLCKKTFKNRGSLNTHLITHTERQRDHTCDKCGKCFFNKQTLLGHMLYHTDKKPHKCEICRQSFKTFQQLRNHVGVHDAKKPFSCDQCGRCFRLQKQLSSHSIIHTDLMPHVCSYCNKGFRFKTILNQHIRQHTGVKPYSCEMCQRDFTNWPNYNKHMKRRHSMDMAKKKHTPDGVYPINPSTGELVVVPESNTTLEWKEKVMSHRRSGRPKVAKQVDTPKDTEVELKQETTTV